MLRENFISRVCIPLFIFFIASCKHADEIPFPENESLFPQPVNQALHFGERQKINLEPEKKQISPTTKDFNVDKFPIKYTNAFGYKPFLKNPKVVSINWNNLPDTTFNYDALPSQPLKFSVSIMAPPKLIRSSRIHLNQNSGSFLAQLGDPLIGFTVYTVTEDRNGFLWIGTERGVYRYDGENLVSYINGTEKLDIGNIIEDEKGRIWITVVGGKTEYGDGLLIIDPVTSIVKRLISKGYEEPNLFLMCRDNQNRVWITNSNSTGPVSVVDEKAGVIKNFTVYLNGINSRPIQVAVDNHSDIWLSTIFGGGLRVIDLKVGKIKYLGKSQGLNTDSLTTLRIDKQNNIWVGGFFGQMNMIDAGRKTITQYGKEQGLPSDLMTSIMDDEKGNIWVGGFLPRGVGSGIFIINPEKRSVRNIREVDGLSSNAVNNILKDSKKQIWIGTRFGLQVTDPSGYHIDHFGEDDMTSMEEDMKGRIWAATSTNGILILDTINQSIRSYTVADGLQSNDLQEIKNQSGQMYIVYQTDGFSIIDSGMRRIAHYGKAGGLSTDTINMITTDRRGKIWVANHNITGIDILDTKDQTIRHIGAEQGLKYKNIVNIKEDKDGMIWFNSTLGDVCVIDKQNNTVRAMTNTTALIDNSANKILFEDSRGNLWMGSNGGVYIVNPKRDSIALISPKEGLLGNNVNSIQEYEKKIYIGTKGGLNILTPPDLSSRHIWEIESIGKSYGLLKEVNTYGSHRLASNGKFYWGDKGITLLEKTSENKSVSPTNITGITIFDQGLNFADEPWKEISKDDSIRDKKTNIIYSNGSLPANTIYAYKNDNKWDSVGGPYNLPKNLVLAYDHNYIRFRFAQVNTVPLDTVGYKYILEGASKQWSAITSDPFSENYLNLPPGDYTFKVAGLSNGKWSASESFSFRIATPWWKTWWAWTLYALALGAVVRFYIQYRSRKLIAENILLEQKVARRTEELSKSLEELKQTQTHLVQSEKMASLGELTAGIAHEIQNPLNFVNNFSEVNGELIDEMNTAIQSGNSSEALAISKDIKLNSEKIAQHGKRADTIVKSMLLHSRTSTGQKEAIDINALADEYLRLSYHGLRAKDKSFNAIIKTDFDQQAGKIKIIPQDIGRVLLNLYNNAFYSVNEKAKISDKKYEPTITVSSHKTAHAVEIRVKDNGIGVPQKIAHKIFQPFFTTKPTGQGTGLGLSLSYDIVTAHRGEIKLETNNSEGAVFVVRLPMES